AATLALLFSALLVGFGGVANAQESDAKVAAAAAKQPRIQKWQGLDELGSSSLRRIIVIRPNRGYLGRSSASFQMGGRRSGRSSKAGGRFRRRFQGHMSHEPRLAARWLVWWHLPASLCRRHQRHCLAFG